MSGIHFDPDDEGAIYCPRCHGWHPAPINGIGHIDSVRLEERFGSAS